MALNGGTIALEKEMPKSLQSRKRQLVRDAIYDAAIELFAKKGFDETTVEEVADAAGISRRSFFRYFESKDDLLALNTVNCGVVLCETVTSCPASLTQLDVVREAVFAGLRFTEEQLHTKQIIEIAQRSASARQAHLSRLMEVQDRLGQTFSTRSKAGSKHFLRPSLLAGLALEAMNCATASWFVGEYKDVQSAGKQAFAELMHLFCGTPSTLDDSRAKPDKKTPALSVSKKSRKN